MTSWTTGLCRTNGIDVHYRRTGGAGSAIVVLHGLIGSGACWAPVARALEAECDVVMPDARGHGHSSAPLDGYSYDDHAADVAGLVRALELSAPILLGHSMGGMTAAVAASRLADSARAVVLVDPTFLSPKRQGELYESDVFEQLRRMCALSKDEWVADARRRHPNRSIETIELQAEARTRTSERAFDVLRPPNPDFRELVSAIRLPILLVLGDAEAGAVVTVETARELQRLNPRVQIERIHETGHGIPFDQPERLAAVVRSFVRSVARA